MKKKLLIFLLGAVLTSMCVGCGAENATNEQSNSASEAVIEESTPEQTIEQAETPKETVEQALETMQEPEPTVEPKPTEEPTPEPTTEPVPEPQVIYTYTDITATMYAAQTVNVRNLPSTDGEKIGSLSTNQEITVLGQCNETNWYMFDYEGQTAFVSNDYLSTEKMEIAPPAQETAQVANVPRAGDYSSGVWHDMGDYSFYIGDWTCPSGATGVAIHLNDGSAKWAWINYSDPQNVALNAFIRTNSCNCSEITHGGIKPLWDEATKSYYFP